MTRPFKAIDLLITEMFGIDADREKLEDFALRAISAASYRCATRYEQNDFRCPYGKENAETSYGYREMTRPK